MKKCRVVQYIKFILLIKYSFVVAEGGLDMEPLQA